MDFSGKINWFAIYFIMALVSIAYFPTIISNRAIYNIVIACIGCIVGIYLFTSYSEFWSTFGKYLIPFTSIYLLVSAFVYFYYDRNYIAQISNFYVSLVCFSMGYLAPNNNLLKINRAVGIYCIFSAIMGVYSVLRNVGTFAITEQYMILLKNSSGVIVATGTLLASYLVIVSFNLRLRIFWSVIALLNFSSLLVFRARSALLALLCVYFIIFIKSILFPDNSKQRRYSLIFLLIIVSLAVSGISSFDMIYDSMFANKDVNSLESISSGRTVMYEKAYQFFLRNQLGGQLASNESLHSVDNFFMNQLGRFGLIGIFTNVPVYIFIWFITIEGIYKKPIEQALPFYALFILCIVSLSEAPFPFGPGTPCMCAYVLLGLFLNYEKYQLNCSEEL